MKKSCFYTLFLLLSLTISNAQKGGAVFFKTGYLYAPGSTSVLESINHSAKNNFTNHYMMIGIEGYYRSGRELISLEGSAAQQVSCSVGAIGFAEPFLTTIQLRFGHIINNKSKSWIYPSIGLGVTSTILEYSKVNGQEVEKSKANSTLYQSLLTPSLDIGFNKDIIIDKVLPHEKKYGGLMVGLRAGYHTGLRKNSWYDGDGNRLVNMPYYSNNYFYFTVSVGAGNFSKK